MLNEIHLETHIKKNGEFVDKRSKKTQEEYDRRLALSLSEHPELPPPPQGYPVDPCLGFQTWYDAARRKRKNGRVYGAGGYAKTIKRRDRTFRMRLDDGEGSSRPPILTADMLETVRNLTQTEAAREAAARQAEMEEMRRRQAQMEEELKRKTAEYEEAMQTANERALKFEQFMAMHMNQGVGGRNEEDEEDDEEVD
ncbi:unnamed protein product [Lathyrus sativus]|nr:unnamed protein product [Lathyrus sativus]